MTDAVVFQYTGGADQFLNGVPSKDLTQQDISELTPEQLALLQANLAGPQPLFKQISLPKAGAVATAAPATPTDHAPRKAKEAKA